MTGKITDGIVNKLGIKNIIELLVERISFTELQSLLLKVFELKVARKDAGDVLKEYESNRFTQPSDIDPVTHRELELGIYSLLPAGFELIETRPLIYRFEWKAYKRVIPWAIPYLIRIGQWFNRMPFSYCKDLEYWLLRKP